jgi:hypothetical protein
MKTIDFLPDIYRQREALRRARMWWSCVVVIFSGAIGASAVTQAFLRHGTQLEFDKLGSEFAQAQSQVQELSTLQSQILRASNEASLYTYLENPWPRTQLIAEIVRPLPVAIRLTRINIAEEEQAKNAIQVGPRNLKAEEEAAAKATPPEKDLARLQDENERRQTTIEIDGHTSDVAKLHNFVGEVSRSPLVAGTTIKSLEAATNNQQGRTRFTLRLIVKGGYCQRGLDNLPAGPAPSSAAPGSVPPASATAQTASSRGPGGGG